MSRIHPSLQPILDALNGAFIANESDQIDAMGDAGIYADHIAAQVTNLTQRDVSNVAFLAYMAGWKRGRNG